MEKVYVATNPHEKAMQRALIQYRDPANYDLVKEALITAHREDLIGFDKKCLIPPRPKRTGDGPLSPKKRRTGDGPLSPKNQGTKAGAKNSSRPASDSRPKRGPKSNTKPGTKSNTKPGTKPSTKTNTKPSTKRGTKPDVKHNKNQNPAGKHITPRSSGKRK